MESLYVSKVKELLKNVTIVLMGDLDKIREHEILRSIKAIIEEIPADSIDWAEVVPIRINLTKINFTLAHYAALSGSLPKGFRAWSISAVVGNRTIYVAEVAARFNSLPEDFNDWHLADEKGWSVAHIYASLRPMPESFTQWDLSTVKEVSVRDIADYVKKAGYPR